MRKWLERGLISLLGAAVVASSSSWAMAVAPTTAPTPPTTNGSPGQGLEISPPVLELEAKPGQTLSAKIRVRNVTKGELIAKGKADDFGAGDDEAGQPKLLLDETGATRYSLKYWVGGVPDLRLAPQELKATDIKISVPANAEPGGHFGVIRFTAIPPELEGTGVALSASVGTLVLLKVAGDVKDNVSLTEFSVSREGRHGTSFEYGPLDFLVRAKNEGTVHEKPQGTIKITDSFGKQVAELKVNDKGGNILPDSIRRFEVPWNKKQLFGKYTANLSLTYGKDKKLAATKTFWVIPWKLLLLAIIGLIALFFVARIALRRYNEYIIQQARKRR